MTTQLRVWASTIHAIACELRDRNHHDLAVAVGKLLFAAGDDLLELDAQDESRHLAYITIDPESVRRGGSTRMAACSCGWRGPERATLEVVVDDAMTHERDA